MNRYIVTFIEWGLHVHCDKLMALVLRTLHLSCLLSHVAGPCYPRNGFKCYHVFFFKSSRFIAEALPERAVIPQELSASEPKVLQCVAS